MKVSVLPASVVTSPVVGVTVIPGDAATGFKFVTETSAGFNPL